MNRFVIRRAAPTGRRADTRRASRLRRARDRGSARRAFTLLESLIASTLLGVVVVSVISAVSAAQSQSIEGQKRILGAMAADDLLLELTTLPYAVLRGYDGFRQAPGDIVSLDGQIYPATFWSVGRSASVRETTMTFGSDQIVVRGVRVLVSAEDERGTLLTIETFVPEPAP